MLGDGWVLGTAGLQLCGCFIYRPSLLDRYLPRQNMTVFLQIFYTNHVQLVYLGTKMLTQFPLVVLHSYLLINITVLRRGPTRHRTPGSAALPDDSLDAHGSSDDQIT